MARGSPHFRFRVEGGVPVEPRAALGQDEQRPSALALPPRLPEPGRREQHHEEPDVSDFGFASWEARTRARGLWFDWHDRGHSRGMSIESVEALLRETTESHAFAAQLGEDPSILTGYDLSEEERAALQARDPGRLRELGVDPELVEAVRTLPAVHPPVR
jgi:hypothetical protein